MFDCDAIVIVWNAFIQADDFVVQFMIGGPLLKEKSNVTERLQTELEREQRKYGDLICYTLEDGYYELPFKVIDEQINV